uniref:Predicted protein n=1 Tax=Hordeum vulgare subsp. vulgare TaxID=112509 RepID=F2EEE2_HORVV|nr:predicted protein [Hordeum vulgare subsp. vulgare]
MKDKGLFAIWAQINFETSSEFVSPYRVWIRRGTGTLKYHGRDITLVADADTKGNPKTRKKKKEIQKGSWYRHR